MIHEYALQPLVVCLASAVTADYVSPAELEKQCQKRGGKEAMKMGKVKHIKFLSKWTAIKCHLLFFRKPRKSS
jgi:hypothetical protein